MDRLSFDSSCRPLVARPVEKRAPIAGSPHALTAQLECAWRWPVEAFRTVLGRRLLRRSVTEGTGGVLYNPSSCRSHWERGAFCTILARVGLYVRTVRRGVRACVLQSPVRVSINEAVSKMTCTRAQFQNASCDRRGESMPLAWLHGRGCPPPRSPCGSFVPRRHGWWLHVGA